MVRTLIDGLVLDNVFMGEFQNEGSDTIFMKSFKIKAWKPSFRASELVHTNLKK
jgi:hypothetical protein